MGLFIKLFTRLIVGMGNDYCPTIDQFTHDSC